MCESEREQVCVAGHVCDRVCVCEREQVCVADRVCVCVQANLLKQC